MSSTAPDSAPPPAPQSQLSVRSGRRSRIVQMLGPKPVVHNPGSPKCSQRVSPPVSPISPATLKKRQSSFTSSLRYSRSLTRLGKARSASQLSATNTFTSRTRSNSLLGSFRTFREDSRNSKQSCPTFQFPAHPDRSAKNDDLPLQTEEAQAHLDLSPKRRLSVVIAGTKDPRVILHGEVFCTMMLFLSRKGYLVLTRTHLIRFKSQSKAAEIFPVVPLSLSVHNRASSYSRHQRSMSNPIQEPVPTVKDLSLPLQQIVALQLSDENCGIELTYFDPQTLSVSTTSLQYPTIKIRDIWFSHIRDATIEAYSRDVEPLPASLVHATCRVVEAADDYDANNFSIYRVVTVPTDSPKTSSKSADDLARSSLIATFYLLAIGLYKIHLIPLSDVLSHASASGLSSFTSHESYGVLSLTDVSLKMDTDILDLVFRIPLNKPRVTRVISLAARDIAARLYQLEANLRRNWTPRVCNFECSSADVTSAVPTLSQALDYNIDTFERLMSAYCISYGVKPANIRYRVTEVQSGGLGFQLLEPVDASCKKYSLFELIAVLRSLRYSPIFTNISLANIDLGILRTTKDTYGSDHASIFDGTSEFPVPSSNSLLVQELRAIAETSLAVTHIDLEGCVSSALPTYRSNTVDKGTGLAEAIVPPRITLQSRLESIVLNNVTLEREDRDLLLQLVGDNSVQLKGLHFRNCSFDDDFIVQFLSQIGTQCFTLESLDISRNAVWLGPSMLQTYLAPFTNIQSLDISGITISKTEAPILSADLLKKWRLRTLAMSGVSFNKATVLSVVEYLGSPESNDLSDLRLNRNNLSGEDLGNILSSLSISRLEGRKMHLDVGENFPEKGHDSFINAIKTDQAPISFSIRSTEYDDERLYRDLIVSLQSNKTIRYLDMAEMRLPSDVSEGTSRELGKLFSLNSTIEYLDISGVNSRLEQAKFGPNLSKALFGLHQNQSLRYLVIEKQMLGLPGAASLAELIRKNRSLEELHCEDNDFSLSAATDIVSAAEENTSLLYLSDFEKSKLVSLRAFELQARGTVEELNLNNIGPVSLSPSRVQSSIQLVRSSTRSLRSTVSRVTRGGLGSRPGSISSQGSQVGRISDNEVRAAVHTMDEQWNLQIEKLRRYLARNRLQSCGDGFASDGETFVVPNLALMGEQDLSTLNEKESNVEENYECEMSEDEEEEEDDDDGLSMLVAPTRFAFEVPVNSPVLPLVPSGFERRRISSSEFRVSSGMMCQPLVSID